MIISKTKFSIAILILVMSTSCVKFKNKSEDQPAAPPESQADSVSDSNVEPVKDVQVNYDGLSAPKVSVVPRGATKGTDGVTDISSNSYNSYAAIFEFDGQWPDELLVTKVNSDSSKVVTIERMNSQRQITLPLQPTGKSVKFYFSLPKAETLHELASVVIKEPQDLIIEGTQSLEDLRKRIEVLGMCMAPCLPNQRIEVRANRVLFKQGSELRTFGIPFVLKATDVAFEDAKILAFPGNSKAAIGERGRSGGSIELYATSMSGHLIVDPKGEDGGDGQPGADPDAANSGRAGRNGTHGIIASREIREKFSMNYYYKIGDQPTAGEDGEDGKKGYPGRPGMPGGRSAFVKVIAAQNTELNVEQVPGAAAGGRGGNPGRGGPGGAAGANGQCFEGCGPETLPWVINCNVPPPTRAGKDGPMGDYGTAGNEGATAPFCVSKSVDNCS